MYLIFDVYETLVYLKDKKPPVSIEKTTFYSDAVEKIKSLSRIGYEVAIACNQGGVAFGHSTHAQVEKFMCHVAKEVGAVTYAYSITHPRATKKRYSGENEYRMPASGLLKYIMANAGFEQEHTLVIGSRDEVRLAAENIGLKFSWANDYFERHNPVSIGVI